MQYVRALRSMYLEHKKKVFCCRLDWCVVLVVVVLVLMRPRKTRTNNIIVGMKIAYQVYNTSQANASIAVTHTSRPPPLPPSPPVIHSLPSHFPTQPADGKSPFRPYTTQPPVPLPCLPRSLACARIEKPFKGTGGHIIMSAKKKWKGTVAREGGELC